MNNPECDNLDAYLCGWLSDEAAAAFAVHLAGCVACRREAEQQRRLDQLLAQGAGRAEAIPSSLVDGIEAGMRGLRRRRIVRLVGGLSAAAAAVLAISLWWTARHAGPPSNPQPEVERRTETAAGRRQLDEVLPAADDATPVVQVRLRNPSEGILVRPILEPSRPNVSIVWIYPTIRPAKTPDAPEIP
jgi:anti-sigma factor RsiW